MIGVFLINMLLCMLLVSCFFTKVRYLPVCTTMYFSQREVSEYRKRLLFTCVCVQFLCLTSDGDMRFEFLIEERRRRIATSYAGEVAHQTRSDVLHVRGDA